MYKLSKYIAYAYVPMCIPYMYEYIEHTFNQKYKSAIYIKIFQLRC